MKLTPKERAHAEELRDALMYTSPTMRATLMPHESGEWPVMDRYLYEMMKERVEERKKKRRR